MGLVHLVYWSFNRNFKNPARATPEPQWMARVEFKSQGRRSHGPRVTYTLPLASLERVAGGTAFDAPGVERSVQAGA